jgi:hypothetical protein
MIVRATTKIRKAIDLRSVCQMSGLVESPSPMRSARPIRMEFCRNGSLDDGETPGHPTDAFRLQNSGFKKHQCTEHNKEIGRDKKEFLQFTFRPFADRNFSWDSCSHPALLGGAMVTNCNRPAHDDPGQGICAFSSGPRYSRNVRLWHLADVDADDEHVCFWG